MWPLPGEPCASLAGVGPLQARREAHAQDSESEGGILDCERLLGLEERLPAHPSPARLREMSPVFYIDEVHMSDYHDLLPCNEEPLACPEAAVMPLSLLRDSGLLGLQSEANKTTSQQWGILEMLGTSEGAAGYAVHSPSVAVPWKADHMWQHGTPSGTSLEIKGRNRT